ncbi:NINE protein [Qipengyuania sp. JC766]|uniref:TM2 domain-containing protein n=1 Tax=Qipengyuania sp. JC766 TaxID=3232139 RepID=UPI00345A5CDB
MSFGRKGLNGAAAAIPASPQAIERVVAPPPEEANDLSRLRNETYREYVSARALVGEDAARARWQERQSDEAAYRGGLGRAAPNPKSVGLAYVLWFFLGGFSVHRFYLGKTESALYQLGLGLLGGVAILMEEVMVGFAILCLRGLWILVDALLIPGMCAQVNERAL